MAMAKRNKITTFEESRLGKIFSELLQLAHKNTSGSTPEAEQMAALAGILDDVKKIIKVFENLDSPVGFMGKSVIVANILTIATGFLGLRTPMEKLVEEQPEEPSGLSETDASLFNKIPPPLRIHHPSLFNLIVLLLSALNKLPDSADTVAELLSFVNHTCSGIEIAFSLLGREIAFKATPVANRQNHFVYQIKAKAGSDEDNKKEDKDDPGEEFNFNTLFETYIPETRQFLRNMVRLYFIQYKDSDHVKQYLANVKVMAEAIRAYTAEDETICQSLFSEAASWLKPWAKLDLSIEEYRQGEQHMETLLQKIQSQIQLMQKKFAALQAQKDHQLLQEVVDPAGNLHSALAFHSLRLQELGDCQKHLEDAKKRCSDKRMQTEQKAIARHLHETSEQVKNIDLTSYPLLSLPSTSLEDYQRILNTRQGILLEQKALLTTASIPQEGSALEMYQCNCAQITALEKELDAKTRLAANYIQQQLVLTWHEKIEKILAHEQTILDASTLPRLSELTEIKPETELEPCREQIQRLNTQSGDIDENIQLLNSIRQNLAAIPALLAQYCNRTVAHQMLDACIVSNQQNYDRIEKSCSEKLEILTRGKSIIAGKQIILAKNLDRAQALAELTNAAGFEKNLVKTIQDLKEAKTALKTLKAETDGATLALIALKQNLADSAMELSKACAEKASLMQSAEIFQKTKGIIQETAALLADINKPVLNHAVPVKSARLPAPEPGLRELSTGEHIDKLESETARLKKNMPDAVFDINTLMKQLNFVHGVLNLPLVPQTHNNISALRQQYDIDFPVMEKLLNLEGDAWLHLLLEGDEDARRDNTKLSSRMQTKYEAMHYYLNTQILPGLQAQIPWAKYAARANFLDQNIAALNALPTRKLNQTFSEYQTELAKKSREIDAQLEILTKAHATHENCYDQNQDALEKLTETANIREKEMEARVEECVKNIDILNAIIPFLKGNTDFVKALDAASAAEVLESKENTCIFFKNLVILKDRYQLLTQHHNTDFDPVIHDNDSILKQALGMSRQRLEDFISDYYTKNLENIPSPEKATFLNAMIPAIRKALEAETPEALLTLCEHLNNFVSALVRHQSAITMLSDKSHGAAAFAYKHWINYYYWCSIHAENFSDRHLQETAIAFKDAETAIFALRYIPYDPEEKLDSLESNPCRRMKTLEDKIRELESKAETAKDIDKEIGHNTFSGLIHGKIDEYKALLPDLKEEIITLMDNAFVPVEGDLADRMNILGAQFQETEKNIQILGEIHLFRNYMNIIMDTEEDYYNTALNNLLNSIDPPSLDPDNYNTLFTQLNRLHQHRFTGQMDSPGKSGLQKRIRDLEITLSFSARLNNLLPQTTGSVQQLPLEQRLTHFFIEKLVHKLTSWYNNSKTTDDLMQFLRQNRKKHPNPKLQLEINELLVALYDQKHFIPDPGMLPGMPHNAIQTLYEKLDAMEEYGNGGCLHERNQPAIDLAKALRKRLNIFVFENRDDIQQGNLDADKLQAFREIFKLQLHSKDIEMNRNRGFFAFLKTETTRAGHIRSLENALNALQTTEPEKGCWSAWF